MVVNVNRGGLRGAREFGRVSWGKTWTGPQARERRWAVILWAIIGARSDKVDTGGLWCNRWRRGMIKMILEDFGAVGGGEGGGDCKMTYVGELGPRRAEFCGGFKH